MYDSLQIGAQVCFSSPVKEIDPVRDFSIGVIVMGKQVSLQVFGDVQDNGIRLV